jgi:hypothetical protein
MAAVVSEAEGCKERNKMERSGFEEIRWKGAVSKNIEGGMREERCILACT